jgi:HAMP domain-containing protein
MKAMFRNTAYIFTKFIQIIRFVKREGKKIQQLYMLYKVLQVAGRAAIVSSILSVILVVFVFPQTTVHVWLAVIGSLLIALSKLLYSRIKPMICLYMNVDCKNYIKTILTPTEGNVKKIEKSSRTVIREYRAAL